MPRNTTRNTTAKSKGAWPNVLRFVASLLFLYVIFGAGSGAWSAWVTSGVGSLWLPILFAVAVLSTISLFFGSLAGIAWNKSGAGMMMKVSMLASFSLVALTVSPAWSSAFWVVILGFLITWLGSAIEMM